MTPASQGQPPPARRVRDTTRASDPLNNAADALLRSAVEARRQHERVAHLLEIGCDDGELHDAAAVCELSHRQLVARTTSYETAAAAGKGRTNDACWHAANTLWHASREYARRDRACDALSAQMNKHSSEKLGELTMEYELAASALLALRQAIDAYRKLRPDVG